MSACGPVLPSLLASLLPLGLSCAKPEPFLPLNSGGSLPAGRGRIHTLAKEQVIAFMYLLGRFRHLCQIPRRGHRRSFCAYSVWKGP